MVDSKMMVDLDEYLTCGVHIGTKFKNVFSKKFIQTAKSDGIRLLDIRKIDDRLKILIDLISKYNPEDVAIMGRRANAKKALNLFSKLTGIDVFTKRYLPGKLTNTELDGFKEYKLVIVCDPFTDKNLLAEAFSQGIMTVGFVDTNNTFKCLDYVVPLNNKGKKALGLAFYLIAKKYLASKKILAEKDFKYSIEDFSQE